MQALKKTTGAIPDYDFIERAGRQFFSWFSVIEATRPLHDLTWRYLFDPDGFRAAGFDPAKGFLFKGTLGNGKSVALRVLQQMTAISSRAQGNLVSVWFVGASDLMRRLRFHDEDIFTKYGYGERGDGPRHLVIDDLGAEKSLVKVYGNEDRLAELLTIRYELFQQRGWITHATTNLLPEELEKHYGARVVDRMRQMFNVYDHLVPTLRANGKA